jgi:chromate transporter
MTSENFGNYQTDQYQFIVSVIIFLVAFIGTRKFKVSPILMIALCGLAGFLLY